jgi:hypothetical protein
VFLIKTMMQRQLIDGAFLQTAGRMAVDVNTVNVDDLLVSRPGGIVRVEGGRVVAGRVIRDRAGLRAELLQGGVQ